MVIFSFLKFDIIILLNGDMGYPNKSLRFYSNISSICN
nr:MAG TPA: hypothetical protein [Caudoviricetes sp.]